MCKNCKILTNFSVLPNICPTSLVLSCHNMLTDNSFPYTFYSLQSDLNKYLQIGPHFGDLLYRKFYLNHKGKLAVQNFFLIEENFSLGCVKNEPSPSFKIHIFCMMNHFYEVLLQKAVFQLPSIDFTFGLNI